MQKMATPSMREIPANRELTDAGEAISSRYTDNKPAMEQVPQVSRAGISGGRAELEGRVACRYRLQTTAPAVIPKHCIPKLVAMISVSAKPN